MHKGLSLAVLPFALLAGCATTGQANPGPDRSLTWLRLGQTASVGGPRVTPLSLIEDSRCPAKVACVWAGQVRVTVRVTTGAGTRNIELATRRPVAVADGTLELVDVRPAKRADAAIPKADYRFGLRFSGGL